MVGLNLGGCVKTAGIVRECDRVAGEFHSGRELMDGAIALHEGSFGSHNEAARACHQSWVRNATATEIVDCAAAHRMQDQLRADAKMRVLRAQQRIARAERARDSNAAQLLHLDEQIAKSGARPRSERDAFVAWKRAEIAWRKVRENTLAEEAARARSALKEPARDLERLGVEELLSEPL